MEAVTAATLLLAGSDLLVMRHPESVKLAKELIKELS
jgi:acetyl-CoA decarbonylase/synthase complex subunit delta